MKKAAQTALLLAAFLVLSGGASQAGSTRFVVEPSSRIELQGTTNIGGWECEGENLEGLLSVNADWTTVGRVIVTLEKLPAGTIRPEAVELDEIPEFFFTVPVDGLDCGNGRMERDLRDALSFPTYKTIRFELSEIRWAELERKRDRDLRFRVYLTGSLQLAGITRETEIEMVVTRKSADMFGVRGEIDLLMTDFEVEPPVAMLGLIRARDALSVEFDLSLKKQTPQAPR